MKKMKSLSAVSVLLLALVSVMVTVAPTVVAIDTTGTVSNWVPINTTQIDSDKPEYDNSGSDICILTCTLRDNNTEADFTYTADEKRQLIIYREPSVDDDGFTDGTDIMVAVYDLSATQVAGDIWFDENGGADNSTNDDGTATDGYIEIEDENDNDGNFELTIGAWTTGHYSAQLNFTDDQDAAQTTFVQDGFTVSASITYSWFYSNGDSLGTSGDLLGQWIANPDTLRAPIDINATTIVWLLVNNTGSNPVQEWTFSFGDVEFTGDTHAETIPIDTNILWANYTSFSDAGAGADPDEVAAKNYTAVDGDGDYTFKFGALLEKHWVVYEIQDIATDDVIRDDTYTVSYTIVSV